MPVMPALPKPDAPDEQVALRQWLESFLHLRGATFSHHDEFWTLDDGRVAKSGWGSRIKRGHGRLPVEVWFDYLDHDIAVWSGHGRREYSEWVDLSNMEHVLLSVEDTLAAMLGTGPIKTSSG